MSNSCSYSKPKIDHFRMVFKAKKGEKRSLHWYRVFNWCVEQCLEAVAKQILPNRMRYEVAGKHRQEFQQKLACCWRLKQFLQLCNAFLGLSSSNYQLEMVKHIKFDHVLDTIFCWFWAESVQCVVSCCCLKFFLNKCSASTTESTIPFAKKFSW